MPLIILILLFLAVLTMVINNSNFKSIEVTKEITIFQDKNKIENKKSIIDSLNVLYNNKYGEIHGNTFTSDLINFLSNQEGEENKVFLFNKSKFCIYTIPEVEEEKTIKSSVQELRDTQYNKNLKCQDINVMDSYNNYDLSENENQIINDFKNLVSSNYFLRVDVESILEFKNLQVPVLNLYIYDITKRFLPNIQSEIKIETSQVVNNKINESKFLLDQIANGIIEKGKRSFKGYIKSVNYANTNSFTNLAEGVYSVSNGITTYEMISPFAESGFQTGNLLALPTRYMTHTTEFVFKNTIANKWNNENKRVDCEYSNSVFQKDNSVKWYTDNSFFACKVIDTTNVLNRFEKIKPDGYCSLEDMCALNFKLNNKGKIIDNEMKAFTLKDYIENSQYGFSFDLSKFKNPFFPNDDFYKDNNFILSSTNGNKPDSTNVSLNLGIKVISRPFGHRTIDTITLSDKVNYEDNYLINKYYITY